MFQSSERRFSMDVPVSARRCRASNAFTARAGQHFVILDALRLVERHEPQRTSRPSAHVMPKQVIRGHIDLMALAANLPSLRGGARHHGNVQLGCELPKLRLPVVHQRGGARSSSCGRSSAKIERSMRPACSETPTRIRSVEACDRRANASVAYTVPMRANSAVPSNTSRAIASASRCEITARRVEDVLLANGA